jgi:oligopeptide/dipeptide ABC transporter ATP-binding protein
MAVLLITHDLGVVAEFCDRVAVMYAGRIVETARSADLFRQPRHRYTQALMNTIPAANAPGRRLPTIAGTVPAPGQRLQGCAYTPRCHASVEPCPRLLPALEGDGHKARCWNPAS